MPAGTSVIHASVNGKPGTREVHVDASTAERLQRDLVEKLEAAATGKKARPCGLFDHKDGRACLLPKRFYWDDAKGVMLEADWTQAGKAAVEGRDYSYWSPCFRLGRDGRVVGLTGGVEVGSLVNNPAFETIARIAAAKAEVDEPADDVVDVNGGARETHAEEEGNDELDDVPVWSENPPRPTRGKPSDESDDNKKKELSPLKRAHLAALEKWRKSKERKAAKDADLQDVRERVRLAAACGKCKPVIENVRERVKAANPYGCNQYGHGFKAEHKGYGAGGQKTLDLGNTVDKERAKEAKEIERLKKDAVDKAKKAREANRAWEYSDSDDDKENKRLRRKAGKAAAEARDAKETLMNKQGERQRKEYEAAPKRGNKDGGNKSWQRQSKVRKAIQSGDDDAAEKAIAEVIEDAKKDGDETGARFWKEMLDSMRQEREEKKRMKEVLERAHRRNSDNVKSSKP